MSPSDQPIQVLLVGDDSLARGGLAARLQAQRGLVVVAQVRSEELRAARAAYPAQVAVWDLGLEPRAALERLRAARSSGLPILALVPDERSASESLGAGARGVLLRDADPDRLSSAAAAIRFGSVVLDEVVSQALLPARASDAAAPAQALTSRELEVLQLLAQGMANKAIAARLNISEHTAKFHVNAILAKLGAEGRTDAVVKAARLGLVMF